MYLPTLLMLLGASAVLPQPVTTTATFRSGEGGYAGAVDVTLTNQNAQWTAGNGRSDKDGMLGVYTTKETPSYETRALLRFSDLRLPKDAVVVSASLTLTFDNWAKAPQIVGYAVTAPWDDRSGRLGWLIRGPGRWSSPGGDIAKAPAVQIDSLSGAGQETVTVELPKELVATWLREPGKNHGLMLVNRSHGLVLRVYSAEDKEVARRPQLAITYQTRTPPTGAQVAQVAQGQTEQGRPAPAPPANLQQAQGRPRLLLFTLPHLRERAKGGDPAWRALLSRCQQHLSGTVEWPNGNRYPNNGGIGEGYQGEGYFEAVMNLGLCYRIAQGIDPAAARKFGDKGADLLQKMSPPEGDPHAANPLRDTGYGIRFYGLGMAIGYDWFYEALPADLRARVRASLWRWLDAFERGGFSRAHPQGNYFAGYYAAKALSGLATEGDDPRGAATWQDFLSRVHGGMVQPYYDKHMRGGGWPEGWNYGPTGSINMALPALGARTAKGIDLLRGQRPFRFPLEQGPHLIHLTWPDLRGIDNRNVPQSGEHGSLVPLPLVLFTDALLRWLGDGQAPLFHSYARAVRERGKLRPALWQELLFWDEGAKERDFRQLGRSYLAQGMGLCAMRSAWTEDAVWATFTAGPYVNAPESGEQFFDQGGLSVVRGGQPLLLNAVTMLQRQVPGDSRRFEAQVTKDLFEDKTRTLFNVFYVNRPDRFGQVPTGPDQAKTRVSLFDDGGEDVVLRGEDLADMYRRSGRWQRPVDAWTRTVIYLRPALFLIHDQTKVDADAGYDQWMAFHLPGPQPQQRGARTTVTQGTRQLISVQPLLPAGRAQQAGQRLRQQPRLPPGGTPGHRRG